MNEGIVPSTQFIKCQNSTVFKYTVLFLFCELV